MKAIYTTYDYICNDEVFSQAYVTIWDGEKYLESFDAPWWGIETTEELKAFLMKTVTEQFEEFKEEMLVHRELVNMLVDDVGLDYAVAIEVAYHIEQKFEVTKK